MIWNMKIQKRNIKLPKYQNAKDNSVKYIWPLKHYLLSSSSNYSLEYLPCHLSQSTHSISMSMPESTAPLIWTIYLLNHTSMPCCSRIAPLVCIQQMISTRGMRKRIPPIKQELAVPTASAFCPNVTQGANQAIKPGRMKTLDASCDKLWNAASRFVISRGS